MITTTAAGGERHSSAATASPDRTKAVRRVFAGVLRRLRFAGDALGKSVGKLFTVTKAVVFSPFAMLKGIRK